MLARPGVTEISLWTEEKQQGNDRRPGSAASIEVAISDFVRSKVGQSVSSGVRMSCGSRYRQMWQTQNLSFTVQVFDFPSFAPGLRNARVIPHLSLPDPWKPV
jgi:hypothetical protein